MLTVGPLGSEPRHGPPRLETFGHPLPIDWRPQPVSAGTKVRCNRAMDR
jgi:hypothetical protein